MRCSQSFLDEIIKFLCSLESSFHVVLKNSLTFYDRNHMTKIIANESLSTIFLRHPAHMALMGPITKSRDPRSGILHIVKDP